MASAESSVNTTTDKGRRTSADIFDNEALWNADDTDDYILTVANDVATELNQSVVELSDAGGNSLLHMAAIWNRPKVMEALIRRGIELNDKNTSGSTPLDLATHYGNVDLALQLRHYGAKHTCESERDVAIAQRDLAQQQLRDVDSDLADALLRLKAAKQEREELRLERDRLVLENSSLMTERVALASEKTTLEQAVGVLTKENQQLLLQAAQIRETLTCESDARLNATQSWQAAQRVISELQDRELVFQAREAEAISLRDEAKTDRDVARELAKLAQLDLGKARQAQMEAEQARDLAIRKQLAAEHAIATEKDLWAKRVAKTERDRKNIQIEIDRQTEALRKECDRLEKQLRTVTTLKWALHEELTDKVAHVERLEAEIHEIKSTKQRLDTEIADLQRHAAILEEAQRTEKKLWRDRLEQTLREEADQAMRRIVFEVTTTAERVGAQGQKLHGLAQATRREFLLQPDLTTSLFGDTAGSRSPSLSLTKPTTLPLLPDRLAWNSASTSALPSPSAPIPRGSSESTGTVLEGVEDSLLLDFCPALPDMSVIISSARAAAHSNINQLTFSEVADLVVTLAEAVRKHMDDTGLFIARNWRHFRKQVHALEKMVERKDELIGRFNQHRRDKPKKQPARLRECIYRPQI